jgi:hypothetical protein
MPTRALVGLRADLSKFVADASDDSMKHVAGGAGKKAALDVAKRDVGADLVLSGFNRRSARLSAGYELGAGSGLTLNLSPTGLWTLMNTGRNGGGRTINPKKRRGGRGGKALNTPWGPRQSVRGSNWGGKGTLADAEHAVEVEVVKAVDREILKIVGGF